MKNSTKKHLLLLIAIIVLMSAAIFAMPMASAASCDCDTPVLVEGETINPTCTTDGYTELICSNCGTLVGKTEPKDALGHSYGEWIFETSGDGSEYNKYCQCERCNTVHYELTGENKAVYYKVTYVNSYAVATYEDLGYTKLAETFQDEIMSFSDSETLENVYKGEYFVKSGDAAQYIGKTPYRYKDRDFGEYKFIGWDDAAALTNVTANTTVKAVFEGNAEVYYYVTFFDDTGVVLSKELSVRHGSPVDDSKIRPMAKKDATVSTVYTFGGWDADISAIYGNAGINATYTSVPQRYTYVFYKYDGTPFYSEDGTTALKETCDYGGRTEVGLGISAEDIARPADLSYVYEWSGQWQLKNRPGCIIDLNYLTVPEGTDIAVKTVELTPVYNKRVRTYDLTVVLSFPEEIAENSVAFYGDNTTIQVTANGQYYGGFGKIVRDPITGQSTIQFTCQVVYSNAYQITARTGDDKYIGEATSIFLNEYGPTKVTVHMAKNDTGERCGCICHNVIFRGLWARILNLIYNIFGRKIVCCDDMYATLGDLLAYTK